MIGVNWVVYKYKAEPFRSLDKMDEPYPDKSGLKDKLEL